MTNRKGVNAADLLGRKLNPVYTDAAREYFVDKTVLVTGAGGSIGSEIVNQLTELGAKNVVCVDGDEYALYNLDLKIRGTALLTDETLILADIRDYDIINRIMNEWKPDVVFHAAAVKHLPLLERSPEVAFMTNVLGTKNVIEAASNNGVSKFVNISTDKAANPTSVLGYTKRIAEMIANHHSSHHMLVASVRFGNVFASRGSFIETLEWQVQNGKDVLITDADASRYFMSIPQAAGLVIETSIIAQSGNTYVLDMGVPVKITEIFKRYVKLVDAEQTKVTFTGLRTGEKLHEVLYDHREDQAKTRHEQIFTVRVSGGNNKLMSDVEELQSMMVSEHVNSSTTIEFLKRMAYEQGDDMNTEVLTKTTTEVTA